MSDPITHLNAALEGRYRIERELGEGGMATVYLADDLKHERKVALKLLKPELAMVVGAERFLAEIKTTANLTHPHILPLHDSGEADSFLFYVMPYVEGESLRERLNREKQLGVEDSLTLTKKVAGALDYAHSHGVVHRDIKPGNILLSEQGEPLVADFGIALAVAQAGGGRLTETGLSLGTPHYMSPEQISGDHDIDPRSDVYALACVLYEMLAGEPPFSASTAQAVLVKILTSDAAPITSVRRTVPPHVDSALARGLEKLPADRFGSAAELATALGDESFRYQAQPLMLIPAPTPELIAQARVEIARPWRRDRRFVASLLATVAMTAFAAWGWILARGSTSEGAPALRTTLDLGEVAMSSMLAEVRISPDGSRFAFVGEGPDGTRAIYLRSAVDMTFRPIPETEGDISVLTFSPDSKWIAYVVGRGGGPVMKVSLLGGAPRTVVPAGTVGARLIDWGAEGWIVFWGAESGETGLYRVPDTGGSVQKLVSEPWVTLNPRMLPDGSGVLFTDQATGVIALYDVAEDSVRTLLPSGLDATYVESGHIVYVDASGGLWAAPFDLGRREMTGEAKPVLQGVTMPGEIWGRYSVSRDGTLVYGAGGQMGGRSQRQLTVVTLDGTSRTVELAPRRFNSPRWSPNGRFIAYSGTGVAAQAGAAANIYVYDVDLKTAPRRVANEGNNRQPVWSPDGRRLVFSSNRDGADGYDLFVRAVDEDVPAELLLSLPGLQRPMDWPEDDLLLFETVTSAGPGLWVAELSDSVRVREYYAPEADVADPRVSPDGTLAVYVSDESGREEVYLRSFPEPGAETLVSEGGGRDPLWSLDGTSIYYLNLVRDSLITARLRRKPVLAVISRAAIPWQPILELDLHPAGDRFIGVQARNTDADDDAEALEERQIVIVNWFEELRQRMGN